jgi:hypothetical protein
MVSVSCSYRNEWRDHTWITGAYVHCLKIGLQLFLASVFTIPGIATCLPRYAFLSKIYARPTLWRG